MHVSSKLRPCLVLMKTNIKNLQIFVLERAQKVAQIDDIIIYYMPLV